jgi:hypothetical protein
MDMVGHKAVVPDLHLIVKPNEKLNLSKAIGENHRQYTSSINKRENWKGYLCGKAFLPHFLYTMTAAQCYGLH